MSIKNPIRELTIEGFKSIRSLRKLEMNRLNVLIGANGVGKSNFVDYFRLLSALVERELQVWVTKQGGADRILSYGVKETTVFSSLISFGLNAYKLKLEPTLDGGLVFEQEKLYFDGVSRAGTSYYIGDGHVESNLKKETEGGYSKTIAEYCYSAISSWKVFHFHDTSVTAGMKRWGSVHDNDYLRSDASNLAAYLYRLSLEEPKLYDQIRRTIRLAIPIFDDFVFKPRELPTEEQQVNLQWKQTNSDYVLWPSQLSDGSIRFICLVAALMQPDPPSTIIIDEPELGLHPYAITLLGALLRSASKNMQVIVSTQSVALVNEFEVEDLIVVERESGDTVFKRLKEEDFSRWLEDYSLGELWQKNVLGGRPA